MISDQNRHQEVRSARTRRSRAQDTYDLEVTYYENPSNRKCYKAVNEKNAPANIILDALFDILERAEKGQIVIRSIMLYNPNEPMGW
ncbi:MAG: hypothetical protein H5T34_01640 [Candidatus Methanomethyliales bacterium]|nr:hypothetical protein [Candidatus Methanomethylicales archaeon]